jgi:methylated-DNA-protein-cysteine methyltransferase-like protein
MKSLTRFQQAVVNIVNLVPHGQVVSYGQVATYAGIPRAARQVGWILRSLETKAEIPWWRIINNTGRISIKGNLHNTPRIQKQLLEQEGIHVTENFELDIEAYRFKASYKQLKKLKLNDIYIDYILSRYSL